MKEYINNIYQKIEILSPIHAKKIRKNIEFYDDSYYKLANAFFEKYTEYLKLEGKTIDFSIDCYLNMISDMNYETVEFIRTGKYSSTTFEEVDKRVYDKPEIMEYYMHGLIMSQFLWKHHYQIFDYFINSLPNYKNSTTNYLEIGAGHGLYLSKALEILKFNTSFTVVDISKTSIDLAERFTNDNRVIFNLKDIFKFEDSEKFDFITMGEVLEHVEDPLKLLLKVKNILSENGTLFITTPTNAPTIDHIYLFNNVREIQELIAASGLKIISEKSFLSEEVSPEKAEKFKVSILYGAFLKK